jgi:hypothetical protein
MQFEDIQLGGLYKDNLNEIIGTCIGKYEGRHENIIDLLPKSLDGANKITPYWVHPNDITEI